MPAFSAKVARNAQRAGMDVPTIPCPHCGEGRVPIPVHLHMVWRVLSDKPQTAAEIADRLKIHPARPAPSVAGILYKLNQLVGYGLAMSPGTRARAGTKAAAEWLRVVS